MVKKGVPFRRVPCRECGKMYRSIEHSHLQAKHGMTIEEYEEKHPDSPRICTQMLMSIGRSDQVWDTIIAYKS